MANIRREIYLSRYFEPVVMPLVQGTNDVTMEFHFADYTLPSDCTAQIYVQKTSTQIYNAGTINNTTNTVTFPTTTQMTAETGTKPAQIRIIKTGTVLQSFAFSLVVLPSIISDSAVESSSEYTALVQALTQVSNFASIINTTAIPANADLDTYTSVGNYYCHTTAIAGSLTNAPVSSCFNMIVAEAGSGTSSYIRRYQLVIAEGNVVAIRFYDASAWTAWRYVHFGNNANVSFDCYSGSDLSNDADNLISGWALVGSSMANLPVASGGLLWAMGSASGNFIHQFYGTQSRTNFVLYMRKKENGTWGSWKSTTFS